jgi:hypothetical protein
MRLGITNPFGGKFVEHQGAGVLVAIAAHHRRDVFERNPDDIRTVRLLGSVSGDGAQGSERGHHAYCNQSIHLSVFHLHFFL